MPKAMEGNRALIRARPLLKCCFRPVSGEKFMQKSLRLAKRLVVKVLTIVAVRPIGLAFQ
jgi:hypothetical protein